MHRFYLSPDQCRGSALTLTGAEAHHAVRVLRLHCGERVVVLDGAGGEWHCEVSRQSGPSVSLAVIERRSIPPPPCSIVLLQAIPKAKLIEGIIQKATELGAARIAPILSERVVTNLDSPGAAIKGEKWQQIAIEAIKQCGNAWLPQVDAPVSLAEFLSRNEKFELPLVACLEPGSRHLRECFEEFHGRHQRPPRSACVWIGPEGDFTRQEYEAIQASGAFPITLGPLVLRVETAATFCLSVLNYELQAPRRS
jgi:16S rRNA (uracil1498-N3)-methyltransferase